MTLRSLFRRGFTTLLVAGLVTVAWPCGPFVPEFRLVVLAIPDGDQADWIAGKLGLLQPSLRTANLVIAWRWLKGVGLDAEERQAVATLPMRDEALQGQEAWNKTRKEVGAPPMELQTGRHEDYREVSIIGDHALTLAAATLRARVKTYGAQSAAFKSWLAAQDQVFNWTDANLPAPADASLPLEIRQDHSYQKAAALLYRDRMGEAVEAFRAVAADAAQPWRGWAKYAIARVYAKVGTVAGVLTADQALKEVVDIQQDHSLSALHADAAALENRIRFLSEPKAFYAQLLTHLGTAHRGKALDQDIEDLRWLRVLEPWTNELKDTKPTGVHAWIDLLQKGTVEQTLAAYDTEPDLPHLVAVLMTLPPTHARAEALLKAAQTASRPDSPAYATLVSHRLRLLVAQKRMKAAEALADEALAHPLASRWPSAFNLWSSVKLAQAANLDGFAAHLGRRLASVDEGYGLLGDSEALALPDKRDSRTLKALDPNAVLLLNQGLPTRLWEELIAAPSFPQELRPELLEALWTRAAILDQPQFMERHRAALAEARPALVKGLDAWAKETNPARKKALAFHLIWDQRLWPQVLMYREEAFQYGTLYARWGSPEPPATPAEKPTPTDWEGNPIRGLFAYALPPAPIFLDDATLKEGRQEASRMAAPLTWFCQQALAFAEAKPDDPLAAEGLSKAVRSSRNANRDRRSADLVVKAFRLLHRRYPNTQAAKEAKVYH